MHDMSAEPDTCIYFLSVGISLGSEIICGMEPAIPSNPIVKNEKKKNTNAKQQQQQKKKRKMNVCAISTPENSAIGIRIEYKYTISIFYVFAYLCAIRTPEALLLLQ